MPLSLSDFDAVTFDVYGTLIDWEPAITDFLRRWADRNDVSSSPQDLLMAFAGMVEFRDPFGDPLLLAADRIGVVAALDADTDGVLEARPRLEQV